MFSVWSLPSAWLLLVVSTGASGPTTKRNGATVVPQSPPTPMPPSHKKSVIITPGPYTVSFERANSNKPFISSHFQPGQNGYSAFNFNLVPAFLTLPSGQDALIVRSVNGTTWDPSKNGTTSTLLNPDKLTLTTFVGSSSDMKSVQVNQILNESVILEPVKDDVYPGATKAEACGLQDPRIVYNKADKTFYMTCCVYSDPLPKDPKTNPLGILCGGAGVGLATTKTPQVKESWVRHGYNCNNGTANNCGKSAAILIRESGPHYMFWGIPTIAVSVSHDLTNWTLVNSSWVVPDADAQEMWVEAGSPPEQLSDGNYIMTYNIADTDLWWGIGYLILDKDDPTKILQRASRMLWPTYPWERADPSNPETSWEYYKNCIGAMNSLHPLPTADEFVGYYVGGDSVIGAAKITVSKTSHGEVADPFGTTLV